MKKDKKPKPQPKPKKQKISLLVPFHSDNEERQRLWRWLNDYWKCELPDAEIIIGVDKKCEGRGRKKGIVFSKTSAVNDAFSRSTGDIIVILDADAYLAGNIIEHCAERIRMARDIGVPMWFVPYQTIYRLNQHGTHKVLKSSPCHDPHRFPSPPAPRDIEDMVGTSWGHKYGALIQIMPREAFELVGGMDSRFRGWGGEDICFLRALDTLFARHKNTPNDILHLWHPKLHIGHDDRWRTRVWAGQDRSRVNDNLAIRYDRARTIEQMAKLVGEDKPKKRIKIMVWKYRRKR